LGLVAQTKEAAADLGIDLRLHLQEPLDSEEIIFSKMSSKIISLCREGVHGIVVSIPSEAIVPAIKECMDLKVPIMSVNSGAEIAAKIGVKHHIGQIEYNAGYEAGERMMALGMKQAICPHESGNIGLIMRCSGFRDAIVDAQNTTNVEWLGMPVLLVGGFDYASLYIRTVEEEVAKLKANWDGLGILLGASAFVEYSLVLKEKYPSIMIGTFDKEEIVYDSIASGDVMFGIDQVRSCVECSDHRRGNRAHSAHFPAHEIALAYVCREITCKAICQFGSLL
jgi:ABC-type sugar transport system substrate-binding protein